MCLSKHMYKKVIAFLAAHNLNAEYYNFNAIKKVFIDEMNNGLQGKLSGGLAMLPTYIEAAGELPADTEVTALDAGGTNFRAATIKFDEQKKPSIENMVSHPMPGSRSYVSKAEFFSTLVSHSLEHLKKSNVIGFCFSYPTKIHPSKDGELLHFSKEIKAPEVIGSLIGEEFKKAMHKAGVKEHKKIIILNDTVATLLAGACYATSLAKTPLHNSSSEPISYSTYISLILGTGTNCAYLEKNRLIRTLTSTDTCQEANSLHPGCGNKGGLKSNTNIEDSAKKEQVINIESGNFSCIKAGDLDEQFDATTETPGKYKLEKMISGAYLGPFCLTVLKAAADENLFSKEFTLSIHKSLKLETKTIAQFLYDSQLMTSPFDKANQTDRLVTAVIFGAIIERAAKLTSITLGAIIEKGGFGKDPLHPVGITADGTTFFKTPNLYYLTRAYLDHYMRIKEGFYFRFLHFDNAPLIGAAAAGALN